jgi:predicted ribosomally synthesized peptide with SipW-like signal peptide
MKNLLLGAIAALVAIGLLPTTAAWADRDSDETTFVAQINALRAATGVAALRTDAGLTSKARVWAQTMADRNTIWHSVLSDGITADWQKLGENVGMGGTVDGLHIAFVNSLHHYENLVDPAFDSIGVGVVRAGDTLFVAEEFMQTRAPKASRPVAVPVGAPAPAKAPAPRAPAVKAATKARATKPATVKAVKVKPAKVAVKVKPAKVKAVKVKAVKVKAVKVKAVKVKV